MKKIPTMFIRNPDNRRYVLPDVTPGCEWVLDGEGAATRKWDGTCVMFDGEDWWARREVKPDSTPPHGWVEADFDETTGKRIGWEPAEQSSFWKFLSEAIEGFTRGRGTYELCGPKINKNPEGFGHHVLLPHGSELFELGDRSYESIREALRDSAAEGIVFWHPDGRKAKIKRRDFPQ